MLKLFAVRSYTNYGETVCLFNAESEAEARTMADNDAWVWDGYEIEEVDTHTKGKVFFGGGEIVC